MLDVLNHWRNRKIPEGVFADIYDGKVWQSFLTVGGENFLNSRYCFGLLINVDWFQPFKHIQYSVGAIYLCILNLPRQLRYCRENMILIGIIPGPREPSLTINSYLEPLVVELLKLWKGVEMTTTEGKQIVCAALICNASDIPACRKVGGFMGHAAFKGCSRCLKTFPTSAFGEKPDYSGFDVSKWPKRSAEIHRQKGMAWKHAKSVVECNNIERDFGVRYTELLRLPYFDPGRYSIVDPMHNMLLGTSKHMVAIWKEQNYLTPVHLEYIQNIVDNFVIPSDLGRIPHKISSGFGSFTADQWKNWVLIFSLVSMKGIVPHQHYLCWHTFVQACYLMCSRAISMEAINKMDKYLITFCKQFEDLYGSKSCTPNMHLHCHLKECFVDYGPASAFWLFACERLNGYLGSVPTNNHEIELQLMRKFTSTQQAFQTFADCADESLKELMQCLQGSKGSLKYEEISELPLTQLSLRTVALGSCCKFLPPVKEASLASEELQFVEETLRICLGQGYIKTLMLHKYSKAIQLYDILYGSVKSIHSRTSLVYVRLLSGQNIPAFVERYIRVTTLVQAEAGPTKHDIVLAKLNLLEHHGQKNFFGSPVEVWRVYSESSCSSCYLPVTNLLGRCAYSKIEIEYKVNNVPFKETVTVVVPNQLYAGITF